MAASANNTTSTSVSSPSDSLVITSPTLSASSLSSSGFNFVAVGQRSSNSEQLDNAATISANIPAHRRHVAHSEEDSSFSDDDEIVWGLSEAEDLGGSTSGLRDVLSDDDFVVLSRARSPVSSSRDRTRTSGSVGSQAGTIRGVPLHSGLLGPHAAVDVPQGTDANLGRERNDKDVASELAKELAKLSVDTDSLVGEASGTRTPVEGGLRTHEPSKPPESLPKKRKKAKKDRTPEEEELRRQKKKERKEKKEREKQDKAAAKALAKAKEKEAAGKATKMKEKKSKPNQPEEPAVAIPQVTSVSIATGSSKSVSTATFAAPTNTTTSRITPMSIVLPEEATPMPSLAPLPSPPLEPVRTPTLVDSLKKKKKKVKKVKATESTTLTQRNTVIAEKVSEQTYDSNSVPTPYNEAVSYITSYLTNAAAHHDPICHLTLLQSLIIELGLIKDISLLPRSIKAAKKFIKPRVFLNIKEYITMRHEGPNVVQGLMFPTRSALVKDMKKKKNFASLQWIKKRGLQDLLVGVFHR